MTEFPEGYLISIVEPIRNGRRQSLEVHVYQLLENVNLLDNQVAHVKYVGNFPYAIRDTAGKQEWRNLTVSEITDKIEAIIKKR